MADKFHFIVGRNKTACGIGPSGRGGRSTVVATSVHEVFTSAPEAEQCQRCVTALAKSAADLERRRAVTLGVLLAVQERQSECKPGGDGPETPKSPCSCMTVCNWPCHPKEFCRRGHERELQREGGGQ